MVGEQGLPALPAWRLTAVKMFPFCFIFALLASFLSVSARAVPSAVKHKGSI